MIYHSHMDTPVQKVIHLTLRLKRYPYASRQQAPMLMNSENSILPSM